MNAIRKVLFVCGRNSTRGRMAEALLRDLGGPAFEVSSAGFETMEASPLVVDALARVGLHLDTVAAQPSVFDLFKEGRRFNFVITVCDETQGEKCPLFPGVARRITWNVPDPSTFTGSDDERLALTIQLRDTLRARILCWLQEIQMESLGADRHTPGSPVSRP